MTIFLQIYENLRTSNIGGSSGRKVQNMQECGKCENLRTFEAQPIFTGSY